jgi:flagellar motor switch/type III secretory pathway protein FliN
LIEVTEISGLKGLKHHDPDKANFALSVLQLLSGVSADEAAGLQVAITDGLPKHIPAFQTADGIAFCVRNLAGLSRVANPSDIDAACDALDIADALLTHIERSLSISLAPVELSPAQNSAGSGAVFEISDLETKISVIIPENHINAAGWIASAGQLSASLHDLPVLVQLSLSGPRLPMSEASAIAGGDLLLLPAKTSAILQIRTPDIAPSLLADGAGLFDLRNGVFCIGDTHDYDTIGENMNADDELTSAKQFGALQVPVTIRLPEKLVQAADIAALKPGGTLRLGAMVQGLVAELVIGGKILATGEIVQMGSDFALLIDERNPIAPSAGDPIAAEDDPLEQEIGDE